MKELIKEAERLYKDIDDIQLMWVKSAKDSDEEGKRFAIGLMHTTMNSVSQLLKCIIDRKDNVVDLSEVFHNAAENPDMRRDLLYDSRFCGYGVLKTMPPYVDEWSYIQKTYGIKRWAYIDDLLPGRR